MAEKQKSEEHEEVRLTPDEVRALQGIVSDWINEDIVSPPYEPALTSVLKKLGTSPDELIRERPVRGPLRPNLG